MNKCVAKFGAIVGLMIMLGGPIAIYGEILSKAGVWVVVWLLVFGTFLLWRVSDLATRGWVFLLSSAVIGVGGKALVGASVPAWLSESILQVMLLVGGGVGAALMADWLMREEEAHSKSPKS